MRTREGTYGYRRIQVVLERRGVRAGGSTIRAIMHDLGLQAVQPQQKSELPCRPRTWMSARTCSGGTPAADEPGKKLCGDIPPQGVGRVGLGGWLGE